MPRNPDLLLDPERSEDPCVNVQEKCHSVPEVKCQVVNERKCSTSDQRECDEAYGDSVTAIKNSDHGKFRKEVGTNFQLSITFGQQCTAVLEDEERRNVFVSVKIFFLGGVIKFLNVGVVDVVRFVSIVLISVVMFIQSGIVKVILKGIVKIKESKEILSQETNCISIICDSIRSL